jgi:REP element-mobilizing transposase RayT
MQQLSNRKSPRANRYDYTSAGAYFITICTQNREESFGKIVDGKMVLNEIGRICDEELHIMLQKRPSVDLHEYVIMPNHVHLLLCVNDCRDDGLPRPNGEAVICSNVNCLSITT